MTNGAERTMLDDAPVLAMLTAPELGTPQRPQEHPQLNATAGDGAHLRFALGNAVGHLMAIEPFGHWFSGVPVL
jgi:hypothetical protein